MQPQIHSTTEPEEPITDFDTWYQYILSLREEEGELRRFKREIEPSFDNLHRSITETNFKRQ